MAATIHASPRLRVSRARDRTIKASRPLAPPTIPPRDNEPRRPPVISTAAPPSHNCVGSTVAADIVPAFRDCRRATA
jgi:hypothetical protein